MVTLCQHYDNCYNYGDYKDLLNKSGEKCEGSIKDFIGCYDDCVFCLLYVGFYKGK